MSREELLAALIEITNGLDSNGKPRRVVGVRELTELIKAAQ